MSTTPIDYQGKSAGQVLYEVTWEKHTHVPFEELSDETKAGWDRFMLKFLEFAQAQLKSAKDD